MPNYIYCAQSLDGYIAREDGNLDWLISIPNPDGSDYGFSAFMKKVDAVVMGRNTFEMVQSFGQWPYTIPVFVLSSTLKELEEGYRDKAEVISGRPLEIVTKLKSKGYQNLYIDGGKTIHAFLEADLIDEFIISTAPVILGRGIPLFPHLNRTVNLDLKSSEKLGTQLVKNSYIRIKGAKEKA